MRRELPDCTWCATGAHANPMCSGVEIGFVCSHCGSSVGYLGWEGLSLLIARLRQENTELKIILRDSDGVTGD